jgi:hypothetical protein
MPASTLIRIGRRASPSKKASIDRPAALTAIAALIAAPAGASEYAFQILRKGEPIGIHRVTVEEAGAETRVETRVEMLVKVGPLPLYRYDHEAREIWRDGAIHAIDSRTNDNGDKSALAARRNGDKLSIDGTAFKGEAPLGVAPSSYWNRNLIGAPILLNTQNGELIAVKTDSLGVTQTPDGSSAEQFRVTGSVALNLWYDGARWVGSNFNIDGEELTYRPMREESGAAAMVAANRDE